MLRWWIKWGDYVSLANTLKRHDFALRSIFGEENYELLNVYKTRSIVTLDDTEVMKKISSKTKMT